MKRATLNDLADALGLSANTVSRALSGKDGVAPHTRDLVRREAERIGYRSGSQWRRSEQKSIALTVTSSSNVFITQLIPAVELALRPLGYSVVIRTTEESPAMEAEAIAAMIEGDHAGAIVIPVQGDSDPWGDAGPMSFPVVAVARELPGTECDLVAHDTYAAMYAATRHALAQGARSLLLFDEDLPVSTNRNRERAFSDAAATVPDAESRVVRIPSRRYETRATPWQPEEGYLAVSAVMAQGAHPDAMLFEDDYFALGALRALEDHGLRAPQDILLVGYGDHPYAPYIRPSLTSVSIPGSRIAEAAVSLLLQRIAGDTSPPVRRLLPGELVVRESSVRPVTAP